VHFLAETIPFYGATTTFKNLRVKYPDYDYKEAALNPTNPEDRAADWEVDVIRSLRDHPGQQETVGERVTPNGPSLYLARPIVAEHSCLGCHSVPSAAPKAMLTVYGSANGFGWKENDIVGAQIISGPTSVPVAAANQAFHRLLLFLILTLLLTAIALDAGVYWLVIRPLKLVSNSADQVSKGEKNVAPLVVAGSDEIAMVTASFNRMQLSLAKALAMLEDGK
jgi:protein-histidine pros-kinase